MKHPLEQIYNQLLMVCADPLKPSAMHGMFCAIACAPGMVPPSVWLKAVYNMNGKAPEFQSKDQMNLVVNGLMDISNEISRGIIIEEVSVYAADNKKCSTDLSDDEIKKWAEGFIFGFSAVPLPDDEKLKEQYYALLSPFLLWVNPEMFAKSISEKTDSDSKEADKELEKLKKNTMETFPQALFGLQTLSRNVLSHKHS